GVEQHEGTAQLTVVGHGGGRGQVPGGDEVGDAVLADVASDGQDVARVGAPVPVLVEVADVELGVGVGPDDEPVPDCGDGVGLSGPVERLHGAGGVVHPCHDAGAEVGAEVGVAVRTQAHGVDRGGRALDVGLDDLAGALV